MAGNKRSNMRVAGSLMLAAALLLAASPAVHAGAVFEIREDVADKVDNDYKFIFNDVTATNGIGSIARSGKVGAGAVFGTSAIPLNIFTLEKCTAVSPHIHPNGAETVFVLQGKVRITQFRGEEDGQKVRVVEVRAGEAGYIQQGSIHFVENISKGTSQFLQIFDHPKAGAVFVSNALVALPRNVVNSAFSDDILYKPVNPLSPLIKIRGCGSYNIQYKY